MIGAVLKSFIYLISSSLLYPVLSLLSLASVWILISSGSFFAEWLERFKLKKTKSSDIPGLILKEEYHEYFSHRVKDFINQLKEINQHNKLAELEIENLLRDTGRNSWKSIDPFNSLIKIAPGLGLIGTLIPMGTGLAALGQGDMTKLSADLVIAFTTTTVGMAVGMTAFFFSALKKRWIEEDIKNMELAAEILTNSEE